MDDTIMENPKKKKSIAFYLTISILLTTAAFETVTIGAAFWVIRWSDTRHYERKISEYFQFLSENLSLPVWNYDNDGIKKIADTFAQNENVSMVEITDENNNVLYRQIRSMQPVTMKRIKNIAFSGRTIGHVKVGFAPGFGKPYYRELLLSFLILVMTLSLLAVITGFFLRKILKTPLNNLIEGMAQIARGSYAFSDHLYDYVEFRKILAQFDRMAQSIRRRESELADMNQELSASETRFRTMAESVPCAIYRCVPESPWNVQFIGPQIETISGYPASDFIHHKARSYADIIHPDDLEMVKGSVKLAMDERRKWIVEYRIIHADGSVRWVYEEGVAVFDHQGEPAYLDGFILDRTEHKQIELELKKSEAHLRTLIETIPDLIWLKDRNGVYISCNPEFERFFGARESEIVGKTDYDFVDRELADFFREKDMIAMVSGRPTMNEEEVTYADDGRRVQLETVKTPLFDSEGKPVGVLGVAHDITQRKRQEEELRNLRNYLANIIDSMPSALIGVDKEGNITRWNREAERITGILQEDAAGQHLTTVIPRLADEMERVRESMKTGEVRSDPARTRWEKGEMCYEDVTVYPLKANGIEGAVIRLDDVTEKVRIKEMIVQSEKMLSVGVLAAGMAHEINNPLAGMMQTANVLSNRLADPQLPANQRAAEEAGTSMTAIQAFMENRGILRMLENIRQSGIRAAEIVSNMLSFARKSDSTMLAHNLSELLERTMDLAGTDFDFKKKHDFRQIEIVREYEDNLPLVPCDEGKIQQVLLNILRNGAEAMQGEEEAGMKRAPRFILRLSHEKKEDMVVMEIEDNGPGMDEETCKRVFEPFFTKKTVGKGTGLGLSVSYFIVTENHGGRLSVESKPGKGSNFIVKLPVKRKTG
ncbi:MAG: PAS domain S-box protein [Desulfobacteraceae bacterium]|nr:MAG: PAS domain S-box protein [Desulfobacteraceae bacterium]